MLQCELQGTGRVTGQAYIFLAGAGSSRHALLIAVMLQLIKHGSHLRSKYNQVIVGNAVLVLAIRHSDGVNRSIGSLGALDDCLSQHGAGSAGGTENQDLLLSLWHSSLSRLCLNLWLHLCHGLGSRSLDSIALIISHTGSNQGLTLYQLLVISTEERIVDNGINNQQQWSQDKGQLCKAGGNNQADSTRSGPRQDVGEGVHAQHIYEELEQPYVGDRSQDERYEQYRVQYDRSTEDDRLIYCEQYRNDGAASYSTELLGLSDEGAHCAEHEGSTSTAQGSYEVRSRVSQDGSCMAACLYNLQVQLDVSDIDSGYSRLYDGRTMDTYEPEHCHCAIDEGDTDVAVSSLEQRLEQLKNPVAEQHAGDILEQEAEYPEEGDGHSQRNQVSIGLCDVVRNFLRQLDGNAAAYEELVDVWHGECYHEGGKQALGAHELSSDALVHALDGEKQETDDGHDHYRYRVNLTELWQLVVEVVSQALGDGCHHQDGQDTHGVAIGLPQKAADVVIPLEIPDFRNTCHQNEQ